MDRGVIHEIQGGMPATEQREWLRKAGVDVDGQCATVYADLLPKTKGQPAKWESRDQAIQDVRSGSRLVVARLHYLGWSIQNRIEVAVKLADKGVSIHVAETGETFGIGTLEAFAKANVEAESAMKREIATAMRRGKQREGAAQGGQPEWKPEPSVLAQARRDWKDRAQELSQSDMERLYGVSRATLRRKFGPRKGE